MAKLKIAVGEDKKLKEFAISFEYSAYRQLSKMWDMDGYDEVMASIQNIFPAPKIPENLKTEKEILKFLENAEINTKLSFDQIDKVGDMALAAMAKFTDELPNRDDVIQTIIFEDQDQLKVLFDSFMDNMPKKGNPQPRKKAGKPKK